MKELKYALTVFASVLTALVLITLGIVVAEFIIELHSSKSIETLLQKISNLPENGIWAITGAIFGSVASVLLLAVWDTYKDYKYTKKLDTAIINCVHEELHNCSQYIRSCTEHLQKEIETINKRPQATLVAPPPLIELNYWGLLRTRIPKSIVKSNNLLSELRTLSNFVISFNSQLDSREQYHIHCKINTNFYEQMEIFDNNLLGILPKLQEYLDSVLNNLERKCLNLT